MFASKVTHINRRGIYVLTALTLLFTPLLSTASGNVRAAPAYTEVGGPIISDTTWTLANSPYIVVANVEVWQDVTLTIQPGVVVKFNKDKLLQVNGALIARGTVANPITFTPNQASPAKGDWKNIEFTDSSLDATFDAAGNYTDGSILEYCVVEYGGNGVNGTIQTDQASPLIDHCVVRNNGSDGIHAVATSDSLMLIRNNAVSSNSAYMGGGIYSEYSMVMGNTVSGNSAWWGGIYAANSTVTGNTVSGNSGMCVQGNCGGGIYAKNSTVAGNAVSGNSTRGVGGGIHAEGSTVTGNTVSGNWAWSFYHGGYGGGGIYAENSTVTGNVVSGNSTRGSTGIPHYTRGGGIYAIVSTVAGNTVSGNSATGDNTLTYGGGIYAEYSPVISNTVTGNTAPSQGSGVYFDGSDDFLYNTIVGNTTSSPADVTGGGVAIDGTPQFHHNNLYGNSNYDVVVLSSGDISGTHNYWGTVTTVDILGHVYDWYDESSRGRLLFIPYIQDPDPNAPVPPPLNLRATFAGGSASLSWDAIPSTTTGYGYKVYYNTDTSGPPYHGAGAAQGSSPIDVGNATQFTLSGLGSGGIVVTITAYDTQGRESWYSNEVSRWRAYLPAVLKR